MTLRPYVSVLLFFTAAFTLEAQEVRVEVVKHADGRPIHGTLLTLVHERDSTELARFSDENGRATFVAPRRGGYRIRAEKTGYDTWTSVVLHPSSNLTRVRAGMKLRSLRLPPVTGSTETLCSSLGEQVTPASDMWGEIRKALAANKVTESQRLVALELDTYERVLDPNGNVLSEQRDQRRGDATHPYRAAGQVNVAGQAFQVPDASALLAPDFVASHCFSAVRGAGPENGLLGLQFKPATLGEKADLSGVLWLDPTTYSLRHLAFDFVNIPAAVRKARATGRLDFQPLSSGEWIVSRWQVRTPRAGNGATIAGFHERGGMARPIGAARAQVIAAVQPVETGRGGARVTGTVFDGTTGKPLADVQITTTSGRRTRTNLSGGYELAVEEGVVDTLVFDHPRLRLLRIPRVRPFAVQSGRAPQVTIMIPSFAALRQALCPVARSAPPVGLAIGFVRDAAGNPIPNAEVSAHWQVLWTEEKGRLVATRQQRTVDTRTEADGSYLLCGFSRDAQVTLRVSTDGTPRVEETVAFPRGMVLERDLRIPGR